MLSKEEMKSYLKEHLTESRYNHTLGVVETAMRLAEINKVDKDKAEIAALAHDIAKNMTIYELRDIINRNSINLSYDEEKTPELWHSIVSPILGREIFKIEDEEILSAMRWHTTGKEDMSKLDKIIYMADMIEPGRNFHGVDLIRKESFADLDKGLLQGLTHTIKYLLNKGFPIDINSIKARNYLLLNK
ncbi:bis(5'-nucleosyl)-tetraphosphatase (symmetrical) YqeK [Clostridium sp.]|uniref:bis(5'-nucleosyl)-tetraphosphatase (symmetrical) YqeK n=1 Tax=Clostridium sp. TaxID=1506 RepID=UPI0025C0D188|nr:bis(5'-nucleosyl)-tetraphosphatase (symmetrical) YqeK [Clostridium sp.]